MYSVFGKWEIIYKIIVKSRTVGLEIFSHVFGWDWLFFYDNIISAEDSLKENKKNWVHNNIWILNCV